jgi:hypothetical protein
MTLTFNPLDTANLEDPYPLYARLHRVGGADAVGLFAGPTVYTYDDVVTDLVRGAVLPDSQPSTDRAGGTRFQTRSSAAFAACPSRSTRLRSWSLLVMGRREPNDPVAVGVAKPQPPACASSASNERLASVPPP